MLEKEDDTTRNTMTTTKATTTSADDDHHQHQRIIIEEEVEEEADDSNEVEQDQEDQLVVGGGDKYHIVQLPNDPYDQLELEHHHRNVQIQQQQLQLEDIDTENDGRRRRRRRRHVALLPRRRRRRNRRRTQQQQQLLLPHQQRRKQRIGPPLVKIKLNHPMERYNEDKFDRVVEHVPTVSFRRSSYLVTFLMMICQFAMFDTYHMLPTGVILYAMAISLAIEQFETERYNEQEFMNAMKYEQEVEIQRQVNIAKFEYHVLRNQLHIQILTNRDDELTGRVVIYAM